jgi:F-type H+-transporting ATPase subunit delta
MRPSLEGGMSISNRQAKRTARLLFRACLHDGKLNDSRARQIVHGIIQSKRRGYLLVLRQLRALLKSQRARQTARIESAVALSSDLLARVHAGLEGAYGRELGAQVAQDASLIGGLRIQVGSDVYDGSVRSRLEALKTLLAIRTGRRAAHEA